MRHLIIRENLMHAFQGITVLDLSQGIAGPVCAAILGRQGARVIKVEPPAGDWMRGIGNSAEGMCANAIAGNLNKEAIAIDAARPAGRDAILRLAAKADVVVENFRTGVMTRLGLGFEAVRAVNPSIIYCSISGFGPTGPLAKKAATDSVLQAYSGMAIANAVTDAGGNRIPKRVGFYVPDNISAIYAAQALSAALFERCSSGAGQHIEISLAECCAAFQAAPLIDALLFPAQAGQHAPAAPAALAAPAGEFETADGWIVVSCLSTEMFARIARAVGHEEWLADPRFAGNQVRARHLSAINAALGDALSHDTTASWVRRLEAADVLVSPINDYATLRDDPQMQAMAYLAAVQQPPYGAVTVPHLPAAGRTLRAAPRLGEHTRALLAESGLDDAAIDTLIADGTAHQRKD